MSLIKWNPESNLFPSFSNWMDDFFDNNNSNWFPAVKGVSIPAVNVKEIEKAFKLEVAAPGFKKEDFKLEMKNGCLTISGETKTEQEEKDEKYTRKEYQYSSFDRSFTLPENVDADHISAEYKDGILMVTLPKMATPESPVKRIGVK